MIIGKNLLSPEPTLLAADSSVEAALQQGESSESVVRAHPESPLAWAMLANEAHAEGRIIESYAFARVGYHRGLDSLRRAGWRGAGPVPWSHEPNRGVLRALYALRRSAAEIGETSEFDRLTDFLNEASAETILVLDQHEASATAASAADATDAGASGATHASGAIGATVTTDDSASNTRGDLAQQDHMNASDSLEGRG